MLKPLSIDKFGLVARRGKKPVLTIKEDGLSFVLFKSPQCEGCKLFQPIFEKLVSSDKGGNVKYFTCDISTNRKVIHMSRSSTTPIDKIPHLLFYINGQPYCRYKGKKNLPSLSAFINNLLATLFSKESASKPFVDPHREQLYQESPQPYQEEIRDEYEEEENRLATPSGVIPHNLPWMAHSKYMKL